MLKKPVSIRPARLIGDCSKRHAASTALHASSSSVPLRNGTANPGTDTPQAATAIRYGLQRRTAIANSHPIGHLFSLSPPTLQRMPAPSQRLFMPFGANGAQPGSALDP